MSKVFSTADVNAHQSRGDLWVVVHNKVYDITEFVVEHPGGEEVLFDEAGKDATESFEDIGHSDEAREMLEKYLVGELDAASRVDNHKFDPIRAGELPEEKPSGSALRVIIPALAVAGVLVYKFILSKN
ncbi:cytochrome b5-like heme/steroid binding domain-containing protein [Absidia repens]|uniref:Cytochrome b5-like heme/steroid binding domain-containing protein n=1 Tax=Absidia repens TaxID=90262 RepID=A0A1X2HHC2_9FUNG|nr:cytochrome b5-like heme/steroid binding domain-containing protein [Absidia repens]